MNARFIPLPILLIFCSFMQSPLAYCKHDEASAKIVDTRGEVYKKGFVDWDKDLWEAPQAAKPGEDLLDGMQVLCADKSQAELACGAASVHTGEKTRLAVSAERKLAYLIEGECVFSKDRQRKDKKDFFLCTKLLQAKLTHGSILVQSNAGLSRLTVLDGSADILNKLDESIVRLEPGVILELRVPIAKPGGPLSEISSTVLPPVDLFQTSKITSALRIVDPALLLKHPLLNGLSKEPENKPAIVEFFQAMQVRMEPLLQKNADKNLLNMILLTNATIVAPPVAFKYKIGPLVGSAFLLPPYSLSISPPTGVIGQASTSGILYVMSKHGVLGSADSEIVLEMELGRTKHQQRAVSSEALKTDTPNKRKKS
jgi:hypothetical protein